MNPKPLRHVDIFSDAGRIEALYRDLDDPAALAVVCHPHPLFGGTLHNKVVFRTARGLERANVATVRFNFRGVGTSQGRHDAGEGEQRDVLAALSWLRKKHPGLPILAGGFSFGSWVASRAACELQEVKAIFLVGTPINKYDFDYLRACRKPMLLLHGSEDEHGDVARLNALTEKLSDAELVVVEKAGHFFDKQLEFVEEVLREWALRVLAD